jgi:predicted lysophospholipase L1 biosynthesis ABC-type transport system permease subunit
MYDAIEVSAEPGVTQTDLADRLSAVVPAGAEAATGARVAKENADAVSGDLKIVNILFMIFAGVALFEGAFIIWNTFTMIVTQRSREIALLRAIGATRRQVLGNLMLEALVLGAAASAIGIALGVAVAQGLRVLMDLRRPCSANLGARSPWAASTPSGTTSTARTAERGIRWSRRRPPTFSMTVKEAVRVSSRMHTVFTVDIVRRTANNVNHGETRGRSQSVHITDAGRRSRLAPGADADRAGVPR